MVYIVYMNNIFIVAIIVISLVIIFYIKKVNIENFMISSCPNCGKRNYIQCFECNSCGWCITPDGHGECIPGNSDGPHFRRDCVDWKYEPKYMSPHMFRQPYTKYKFPTFMRWYKYY
jgi:hypothetical protein